MARVRRHSIKMGLFKWWIKKTAVKGKGSRKHGGEKFLLLLFLTKKHWFWYKPRGHAITLQNWGGLALSVCEYQWVQFLSFSPKEGVRGNIQLLHYLKRITEGEPLTYHRKQRVLTCFIFIPHMEPLTSITNRMFLGIGSRFSGAKKCTKYPLKTWKTKHMYGSDDGQCLDGREWRLETTKERRAGLGKEEGVPEDENKSRGRNLACSHPSLLMSLAPLLWGSKPFSGLLSQPTLLHSVPFHFTGPYLKPLSRHSTKHWWISAKHWWIRQSLPS